MVYQPLRSYMAPIPTLCARLAWWCDTLKLRKSFGAIYISCSFSFRIPCFETWNQTTVCFCRETCSHTLLKIFLLGAGFLRKRYGNFFLANKPLNCNIMPIFVERSTFCFWYPNLTFVIIWFFWSLPCSAFWSIEMLTSSWGVTVALTAAYSIRTRASTRLSLSSIFETFSVKCLQSGLYGQILLAAWMS